MRALQGVLPGLVLVGVLSCSPARAADPASVEVQGASVVLTYLDGEREQREVERGRRFQVVGRAGTYYVVQDGQRQGLLPIHAVIPLKTPPAKSRWEYVVTTAEAPLVVKAGRRNTPDTVPQGQVLEDPEMLEYHDPRNSAPREPLREVPPAPPR